MKHTIITIVLSACFLIANAKITTSKPDVMHDSMTGMHKPFANIKFDMEDNVATFSKLPLHAISMTIMDEEGKIAASATVTRKNNRVNVKQLQPGRYTIVLKQGNKVKMFGYHTDITVRSQRAHS